MKSLRLGMLLMILFILIAVALPLIGANLYKRFLNVDEDKVSVYFHESGETIFLSQDEYVLSVTLSKIDRSYSKNTVKAAVTAMRSASLYLKGACRELCYADADYCDCDSSLTYTSKDDYIQKYGENGKIWVSEIQEAINETSGMILLYKSSYALALIHRSSYITTESSFDVFGRQYPYLEPVITSEKAEVNEIFVLESDLLRRLGDDFKNMQSAGADMSPSVTPNRAGRAEKITIYGKEISSAEFAEIFNIPSMSFEIEEAYGGIVIRSYGEGNGLGMSLAGAETMSEKGFDFSEILLYYFRGCKIISENE